MTLDINLHRTFLFKILNDIYKDSALAPLLGFKGGTAALMFYDLDRFSVDLDFDLLDQTKEDFVNEKVSGIVKKYGIVKDEHKKLMTLFWKIAYGENQHNIKVEINRQHSGSRFEVKTYLGTPMLVMVREDAVANKLIAMYERIGRTSRDIYDVWYFLGKGWSINEELVKTRMGMGLNELMEKCVVKLEKIKKRDILNGLGELLTENQKDRAKARMIPETVALLKLRYNEK